MRDAGFTLRVWASLVDTSLCAVAAPIVTSLSDRVSGNVIRYFMTEAIVGEGVTAELVLACIVALSIAVFAGAVVWFLGSAIFLGSMERFTGATPGKHLVGLRVVGAAGERPGFFRAVSRQSMKAISLLPFGLGFLMPLWTQQKQALHDKLTQCRVIRIEANRAIRMFAAAVLSAALLAASYPSIRARGDVFLAQLHRINHAYRTVGPAAAAAWKIVQQGLAELERSR